MRDYKLRLLDEYRDLIRKRAKLEVYLDNDVEGQIPPEREKLLREQLETMLHYEEILFKRLIIEMGEEI